MKPKKKIIYRCFTIPDNSEEETTRSLKRAQPFIDAFGYPVSGIFQSYGLRHILNRIPDRSEMHVPAALLPPEETLRLPDLQFKPFTVFPHQLLN